MIAIAAEVLATTQASPPLWGEEHAELPLELIPFQRDRTKLAER
jgi:hypothetical protein